MEAGIPDSKTFVRLPTTAGRNQPAAHVKILQRIDPHLQSGIAFYGKLHRPGAKVPIEELGPHGVAVECAGLARGNTFKHGRKIPTVWILWQYDFSHQYWREISRSSSMGWEWQVDLMAPAMRVLNPDPDTNDMLQRGRELGDELMQLIDQKLVAEVNSVKMSILSSLHDQISGRLAQMADNARR